MLNAYALKYFILDLVYNYLFVNSLEKLQHLLTLFILLQVLFSLTSKRNVFIHSFFYILSLSFIGEFHLQQLQYLFTSFLATYATDQYVLQQLLSYWLLLFFGTTKTKVLKISLLSFLTLLINIYPNHNDQTITFSLKSCS